MRDFLAEHPRLGPVYDGVGLFDVYSSPWFSAIYLLLFVSLVGCIIPRVGDYTRALRARPPADAAQSGPAAGVRIARPTVRRPHGARAGRANCCGSGATGSITADAAVAAERGYLREAGNLVFHVSLLFLLLGVGIGTLFGFRGTSVVIVGQGFANNLTQYDDFSSGARFTERDLEPFSLTVATSR